MRTCPVNGAGATLLAVAIVLLSAGSAVAAGFSPVAVDYSADRYISGEGDTVMAGKVYYSPGKERTEWGDGQSVSIVRQDKKVIWTLMPTEKAYVEHGFGEGKERKGDFQECDVRQADVGTEAVNGVQTRKRTVEISCPDNTSFSGTVWLTKEEIPMRMETADKGDRSGRKVFRMELKNLVIATQDPRLFEIPAGYKKFEMPSMGEMDLQKMMKERQPEAPPPDKKPAKSAETGRSYTAQPREKSAIDQVLDPAKKIKSLFGW